MFITMQMNIVFCVFCCFCISVCGVIPTDGYKCRSRDVTDGIPENTTCYEFIRNETDIGDKIDQLRDSGLEMPEITYLIHNLDRYLQMTKYYMNRHCYSDESGTQVSCAANACFGILNDYFDARACEQKCEGWECLDINDFTTPQTSPAPTKNFTLATRTENVSQTSRNMSEKDYSRWSTESFFGGLALGLLLGVPIGCVIFWCNHRRTKAQYTEGQHTEGVSTSTQTDDRAESEDGGDTTDEVDVFGDESDTESTGLTEAKRSKRPKRKRISRLLSTDEGGEEHQTGTVINVETRM